MAEKALGAVKGLFSRLGLKAPWKLTGVASTPEFLTALPQAAEWRKQSPGSLKLKALVPHANTENVYDIRYWVRDTRREGMLVGGTNKKHVVKYEIDPTAQSQALEALSVPPPLGKPFKWGKRKNLLDVENNGYT